MPLSPLDRAAESLAPSPPTTNFFGSPSPIAALYNARRDAESSAQLADAATRLGRSRWDRAAQRRQLVQWGREDEDYAARRDFEARRGDFLQQIALIDPTDPDYENAKTKLLGTLPRQAMDDDAVRAIFAAKDRTFSSIAEDQARMQWYEKRQADDRAKAWDAAQVRAAQAGMTPDEIGQYSDPLELGFAAGQRARDLYEVKRDAESARIKDRGSKGGPDPKAARDALVNLVQDDGRFPKTTTDSQGKTYSGEARLAAEMNRAVGVSKEKYVNAVEGLSDYGKAVRARVWEEAKAEREKAGVQAPTPAPPAASPPPPPTGAAPPAGVAAQPVLDLPAPPQPGAVIPRDVLLKFLDASGGNPDETRQRVQAAGWRMAPSQR
jgi:hypothetical protein